MLRLAGCLIVMAGSSGLALRIVKERREYLEWCRTWRELFLLMENEIAFQKSSLPEICGRAGRYLSGNKGDFLGRVGAILKEGGGGTLGEIWSREAEHVFEEEPLKREVEREVKGLGEKLCYEDSDMQRKILQSVESGLKRHEEEQENLDREKNRLTLCAGVMGGLLLTILLL